METVTISKNDLELLLCDVIFTENDIDLFLSENYRAVRFTEQYLDAKKRFDVVIKKIQKMIEK